MKPKSVLLSVFFSFMLIGGVFAQEKQAYEYASVVYAAPLKKDALKNCSISISKEGKFEKTDLEIGDGTILDNLTPVLEYINKLAQEGWEIHNMSTYGVPIPGGGEALHIYYTLRKRIK